MLADTLAAYCAELRFNQLPPPVIEAAKVKIVDTLGCAFAALGTETADVLRASANNYLASGEVALWGLGRESSVLDAAFYNGVLAHALLHDDTDLESGHVACMVVPAALAVAGQLHAQRVQVSGQEILTAIVLGYEIMWRASGCGAVVAGSLERGFRGYIVNGALGAAAAAARVMGLPRAGHRNALSCAANAISGLLEPVGLASIERSMMAGNNARTGTHAALLANSGLTGTPSILEGAQGYFYAVGGLSSFSAEQCTRDLGARHRILDTHFKLYPSAGANQSAIYAAEVFRQRHRPDCDSIARVKVIQYPLFGNAVMLSSGKPAYPSILSAGPYSNVEETLPNKPFGVASMLLNGRHDVDAIFAGLDNTRLQQLAAKIGSDGDGAFGPLDAAIEITFQNGERIVERVDCGKEPRFYPTMADMPQRRRAMCGEHLSGVAIDQLVTAVEGIQQSGGATRLLDLLGALGEPSGRARTSAAVQT